MNIRSLVKKDLGVLDNLFERHSRYISTFGRWEGYFLDYEKGRKIVFVIEQDNQIIGLGSLRFTSEYPYFKENDIPEIYDVCVESQYQKQGLGTALISELEKQARKLGYKKIGLSAGFHQYYSNAQRLYFKLGYIPDGNGATYNYQPVVRGEKRPIDDQLLLWFVKDL